jgi:aminopeptidase N
VVIEAAGEPEIAAERDRDRSAQGGEHAARCRAAIGDPAAKARAWETIINDDVASVRLVVATAEGFWQPEQQALTEPYVPRYFAEMPVAVARRPPGSSSQLLLSAFPQYAVSPRTVALAESLLARDDVRPVLRRSVVDSLDELHRALAARTLS